MSTEAHTKRQAPDPPRKTDRFELWDSQVITIDMLERDLEKPDAGAKESMDFETRLALYDAGYDVTDECEGLLQA